MNLLGLKQKLIMFRQNKSLKKTRFKHAILTPKVFFVCLFKFKHYKL